MNWISRIRLHHRLRHPRLQPRPRVRPRERLQRPRLRLRPRPRSPRSYRFRSEPSDYALARGASSTTTTTPTAWPSASSPTTPSTSTTSSSASRSLRSEPRSYRGAFKSRQPPRAGPVRQGGLPKSATARSSASSSRSTSKGVRSPEERAKIRRRFEREPSDYTQVRVRAKRLHAGQTEPALQQCQDHLRPEGPYQPQRLRRRQGLQHGQGEGKG